MTNRLIFLFFFTQIAISPLLPFFGLPRDCLAAGQLPAGVADHIKTRISARDQATPAPLAGESLHAPALVAAFYEQRNFLPAWPGSERQFTPAAELIEAIGGIDREGLTPRHYHLGAMQELLARLRPGDGENQEPDAGTIADLDLLLTDAFFLLSCHLASGCRNPEVLAPQWPAGPEKTAAITMLATALAQERIKETLLDLIPREKIYANLRPALATYRELAAKTTWTLLPDGPSLKPGETDRRIPALRQRLAVLGDLPAARQGRSDELYNEPLRQAVLRFQKRHGLEADGVIGAKTLAALNVSPEKRLRQIALNLERLRWSFRNPGDRYIVVNIADFSLAVVENGASVLAMNVIVGKPFQYTPVFSQKLRSLVLNPSWGIPRGIAVEEILPKVRKDPGYLAKQQIKVLRNGRVVGDAELRTIDWSRLTINNFPFELRQEPGPKNPLGRIKFLFPNQFDVYLHDSPQKGLFRQNVRAFSHGCIRIEKPVELAHYLLGADPTWTREAIAEAMKSGQERKITLPQPVPVYLIYLTAWVDDNNTLQFRDDIYGRDVTIDESLPASHPPPAKENAAMAP
jgi:murein L,D-transpeptidase YcbB/YkuD